MAHHSDAIGYLNELRSHVSAGWFSYICDLAISATNASLSDKQSEILWSLFLEKACFLPRSASQAQATPPAAASTTPRTPNFLEELSNFSNFKRLSDTLRIRFTKQVTIVFGANASGKSSLCEAVKVLANPEAPSSPIQNVKTRSSVQTSFLYKFRQDPVPNKWDPTQGYGVRSPDIKYFDSSIAIRHIRGALQPEDVVELSPFRLEVFDYCRTFTEALRDRAEQCLTASQESIDQSIQALKERFSSAPPEVSDAIHSVSVDEYTAFRDAVTSHVPFSETHKATMEEGLRSLDRLNAATTEQGLKLLRAEVSALRRCKLAATGFYELAAETSPAAVRVMVAELEQKTRAQRALSGDILPENVDLDKFKSFLEAAGEVFDFAAGPGSLCPFCRQTLDEQALALIDRYRQFLSDELQKDMADLESKIRLSMDALGVVRNYETQSIGADGGLVPEKIRSKLVKCIADAKAAIPPSIEELQNVDISKYSEYEQLIEVVDEIEIEIKKRDAAITTATSGKEGAEKERERLALEIARLKYHKLFTANYAALAELLDQMEQHKVLRQRIDKTGFPARLRRMTNAGKEAYNELVLNEFENALDGEYYALSGNHLSDLGIQLISRGEQQAISVEPQIGDTAIERILSEGEQKIHALAIFFSEASVRPKDVIVFDDPVASFCYNYTEAFTEQLRDFIRDRPSTQIIVFTHNWDFFVQLQLTLNRSGLNDQFSVMVLENCSHAEEYKEDINDLKDKTDAILNILGEPSRAQKEHLSGYMRRLIETVVNKIVFNGQRHQYKQKSLPVSDFYGFTKLVPLEQSEAERLKELYAKLSITEHDDPRNAYVSRSKAEFQRWYDEVLQIEAALAARRP